MIPVSIILPTYNRLFILKSILTKYLSLPVEEVIVVNDASNDGTKEYLDALENDKLKVIHHKKRKYLPATRNSGIQASSHPYILMGEDDVIMDEDYIKVLYDEMKRLDADIIAGRLISLKKGEKPKDALIRIENNPAKHFLYPNRLSSDFSFKPEEAKETPFIHACSVIKKKWAENFPYCEEYRGNALREESHFYFNCLMHGAKIFFTPKCSAFHMYHDYQGGCRGNQLKYAISSIVNNHRFLHNFWSEVKKASGNKSSRLVMEIKLVLNCLFNALSHSLRNNFPKIHRFLKRNR